MSLVKEELGTTFDRFPWYRILIKAPVFPEKLPSGLYMPEAYQDVRAKAYNIGRVLKIGPNCFQPTERFPQGPLCVEGDWIYYSTYMRSESYINDYLCYFINDDAVITPIDDIGSAIPFFKKLTPIQIREESPVHIKDKAA